MFDSMANMTGDPLALFPAEPSPPDAPGREYSARELHYLRHTLEVMLERHPSSSLCDQRRHLLAYCEAELSKLTTRPVTSAGDHSASPDAISEGLL